MAEMSNAQAALMAAATRWSGIAATGPVVVESTMTEAEKYLTWLDAQDAARAAGVPTPHGPDVRDRGSE